MARVFSLFFFSLVSLLLTSTNSFAQSKTINGTVLDAVSGKPLGSASVRLQGSSAGTSTDSSGEFSLTVPSLPCTITVHYIGYDSVTQVVKRTTFTVGMTSSEQDDLNDVVVVGYGNQKARNVTGAISSLNAENFDERPINRLEQGLVGQIPGVRVRTTSGIPGAAMSINIRGASSMGAGNEPLYVIDGFPLTTTSQNSSGNWSNGSPLDNINPNDIASIEVLKDAAAGAIYGSRASNGVVIITTKKGKLGKNKINVNAYYGISKEAKRLDMLNSEEWISRAKGWIDDNWINSGEGRTADQTTAQRGDILGLPAGQVDPQLMYDDRWDEPGHPGLDYLDWQDMAFRNGNFQNYQLSSSGGTKNVRYYISGNYQYQKGYVIGLDYKTYSARANVEANLTKGIKFGVNLAPSYSIQNNPGVEGKDNTLHKIIGTTPVMENTPNENGGLYQSAYPWGSSGTNPIPRLEDRVGIHKNFRTIATTYLDVDLISHLKLRTSLNFSNSDRTSHSYLPADNLESIKGTYGTSRTQTLVNENTITYANTFGEKHHLTAVAGHSYSTYRVEGSGITSSGNYDNYFTQVVPANSNGSSNANKNVMISFFGRAQYDYMGKYLLSASIRRDGSSRFGKNERWGDFPSVSAGWRISDEPFFKDHVKFINDLKIRASYGAAGNNNIGDYSWSSTLASYNYSFNNNPALGRGVGNIPNPNLTWEKSYSNNYGLDFSMFASRLTGSVDYYTKKSTSLLLNLPVLAATGFTNYLTNIGEVMNKGWELELNSRNINRKEFSWETSLNLSHNQNEVRQLDGDQSRIEINGSYTSDAYAIMQVGLPMYTIFVVQQDGVLSQADIDGGYPIVSGQKVGDARYIDANDDGKITGSDRVVVGHPNPSLFWGITNTFKFKGFDLSFLFQGQSGGKIYSLLGRAVNRVGISMGENILDIDPAVRGNYKTSYTAPVNTDWLYSSNYYSLRNITLGYDLGKVLKGALVDNARIYISAENLIYFTDYSGGFNPEAENANLSSNSNYPLPGDYGGLPISRNVVIGLNVNF